MLLIEFRLIHNERYWTANMKCICRRENLKRHANWIRHVEMIDITGAQYKLLCNVKLMYCVSFHIQMQTWDVSTLFQIVLAGFVVFFDLQKHTGRSQVHHCERFERVNARDGRLIKMLSRYAKALRETLTAPRFNLRSPPSYPDGFLFFFSSHRSVKYHLFISSK